MYVDYKIVILLGWDLDNNFYLFDYLEIKIKKFIKWVFFNGFCDCYYWGIVFRNEYIWLVEEDI